MIILQQHCNFHDVFITRQEEEWRRKRQKEEDLLMKVKVRWQYMPFRNAIILWYQFSI